MKKPRKDRGTDTKLATPIIAMLLLLIANGQAFVVTLQPACG